MEQCVFWEDMKTQAKITCFLDKVFWRDTNLSVFSVGALVNFFIHIHSLSIPYPNLLNKLLLSPYICSVNTAIGISWSFNPYPTLMMQVGVVKGSLSATCQVMIFQRPSCRTELGASSASDFRKYFLSSKNQHPPATALRQNDSKSCVISMEGCCFHNMFFFVAWCVCLWGSGCHRNGIRESVIDCELHVSVMFKSS